MDVWNNAPSLMLQKTVALSYPLQAETYCNCVVQEKKEETNEKLNNESV